MRAAGTRLGGRVALGGVVTLAVGAAWLSLPRASWAEEGTVRCVPDNARSSADTGRALSPGVVAVPAPSGGGQIICVPQPSAMGMNQPEPSEDQPAPSATNEQREPAPSATNDQREPVSGRDQPAECGNRVIYFATGSSALDENAKELLRQSSRCLGSVGVAGRLGATGSEGALGLSVVGGTDAQGSATMNRRLGERRAEVVRRFLGEQGLSGEQITTATVGEDQPVCNDQSADCMARNRRAVIRVEPQGALSSPPRPGERTPPPEPAGEDPDQSPGQP